MDKESIIGFVLIALVLIVWMWLQNPPAPRQPAGTSPDTMQRAEQARADSLRAALAMQPPPVSPLPSDSLGRFFSGRERGIEKTLVVKTDLYTAEVTTRGGLIRKWELKKYLSWDKVPVQLVNYDRGGDLSLMFMTADGKRVDTKGLFFDADFPAWKTVELTGTQSLTVDLSLPAAGGGRLVKRLTFSNGSYAFRETVMLDSLAAVISNYEYQVTWENGLRYAEHNSVDESSFAMAYASSGGEVTDIDASKAGETVKRDINGATGWVAARTKYFAVAMLPEQDASDGAYLEGNRIQEANNGSREEYLLALKIPYHGRAVDSTSLTVFLGPLDFDIVKSFGRGLDQIMSLGAAWIIRPIAEYGMMPLFHFLRYLIANFGIVIIVFSIIIKVILHPLTKTSMKSMRKMQALTPMMNEIREKYKENPQDMNQRIMKLYKEYGVNPAAGCLPLLLQMPILFALYAVFRSSIELRQASFVWWIQDLSIPDSIAKLPFTIPFFGITEVSGLALAMGVTMFVQQKMSTTDPRQKAMVWMMPVMMTLLFNSLPAGLNLYYFVFNLLSIGQQTWINKQHAGEALRKVDPKKSKPGFMERLTKDLPRPK